MLLLQPKFASKCVLDINLAYGEGAGVGEGVSVQFPQLALSILKCSK